MPAASEPYYRRRLPTAGRWGPRLARALVAGFGAAIALGLIIEFGRLDQHLVLVSAYGSSAAILFAFPDSPVARPHRVIGSYVIATGIGLACAAWLGIGPWTAALAVGLTLAAMMLTTLMHPPAAGMPVLVGLIAHPWSTLGYAVAGSAALVGFAWAYGRLAARLPPEK